jgi:alpha-galactosidase
MSRFSGELTYFLNGQKQNLEFQEKIIQDENGTEVLIEKKVSQGYEILNLSIRTESEIVLDSIHLEKEVDLSGEDRIFINGYQSWSLSREYRPDEKISGISRLMRPLHAQYKLKYLGDEHFHTYNRKAGGMHSYTYTYIRRPSGKIEFYGSLTEKTGFTLFQYFIKENRVRIEKECSGIKVQGGYNVFSIFTAKGNDDIVFDNYFKAMKLPKLKSMPISGWTSWYYHYTKISEQIVLENLKGFKEKKLPIQVFQIDDGYQNAVGDWLDIKNSFPNGMKFLASEIKKARVMPGLWIAPFIAEQKSVLFKNHRDWFLKYPDGKLAVAGFNDKWNGYFYALDIYNPWVRDYLRRVFDTVLNQWGYGLIKLDFLYAACLVTRDNKTRGQIMTDAMAFLRELAGDKLILGCGVPLGAAFGMVDYCRIGCDVGMEWEFMNTAMINYRERISTVNSIVDTIGRRQLNGRAFHNDPDVFILREDSHGLSRAQQNTLFIMNVLFGNVLFTSDNVGSYSGDVLKKYKQLFQIDKKKILSVKSHDYFYKWKHRSSIHQLTLGVRPYETVMEISARLNGRVYLVLTNLGRKKVSIRVMNRVYDLAPFSTGVYTENGKPAALFAD